MSNIFSIINSLGFYNTLNIVYQTTKTYLNGYIYPSQSIHKHKNHYVITYFYNDNEYKILHKINKKKKKIILSIQNENNEEILESIKPYLGPFMDFHNIQYSPIDLGYKELLFNIIGEKPRKFINNEIINLI